MSYTGSDFPNVDPTDVRMLSFTYGATDGIQSGETISSVAWSIAPVYGAGGGAAATGTSTITGLVVSQEFSGFVGGCRYRVQAQATTSLGQKLTKYSYIYCPGIR